MTRIRRISLPVTQGEESPVVDHRIVDLLQSLAAVFGKRHAFADTKFEVLQRHDGALQIAARRFIAKSAQHFHHDLRVKKAFQTDEAAVKRYVGFRDQFSGNPGIVALHEVAVLTDRRNRRVLQNNRQARVAFGIAALGQQPQRSARAARGRRHPSA